MDGKLVLLEAKCAYNELSSTVIVKVLPDSVKHFVLFTAVLF